MRARILFIFSYLQRVELKIKTCNYRLVKMNRFDCEFIVDNAAG
jgi:hypothetical protein